MANCCLFYVCRVDNGTMAESLSKMCLPSHLDKSDPETLVVQVPPTRPDVIHKADIVEDVAIAHGFDNIEKTIPKTSTIGEQVCDW